MKRMSLVILLGIALIVGAFPIAWAAPGVPEKERHHTEKGAKVAKRVRDLQKYNSRVRAALNIFEVNGKKNGHSPKLDEAVSMTRDSEDGNNKQSALKMANSPSPFQKVGFTPQTPDYTEYGFEMIFIPSYNTASEWQGTVIINQYDPSGLYIGDYVADVAVTLYNGDVIEEVSYSDGEAWLQYGSPFFQFGAPIDTQDPSIIQPLISGLAKPSFINASFAPQGIGWEAGNRPKAPPGNRPNPKVRLVLKCSALSLSGVGVACGLASIPVAGGAFLPCFGSWGAGAVTVCTLTAIFGT
jgi:hypothetical protein